MLNVLRSCWVNIEPSESGMAESHKKCRDNYPSGITQNPEKFNCKYNIYLWFLDFIIN